MPITTTLVLEVPPVEVMEEKQRKIVQLVDLAETMGFPLNGFMNENDLLCSMRDIELELLSEYIYKKDHNFPEDSIMSSELELEKYHVIVGKILDTLNINN